MVEEKGFRGSPLRGYKVAMELGGGVGIGEEEEEEYEGRREAEDLGKAVERLDGFSQNSQFFSFRSLKLRISHFIGPLRISPSGFDSLGYPKYLYDPK